MSILMNISPTLERATLDIYYVTKELCNAHEAYSGLLIHPDIDDAKATAGVTILTTSDPENSLLITYFESSNSILVSYKTQRIEGIPGNVGVTAAIGATPPTVSPADTELWYTALRELMNGILDRHTSGALKLIIERCCKCDSLEHTTSINGN